LLEGCWTVAGRLEIQQPQKDPKSMKHEKRQKYVRTSKVTGWEAYKQIW